MITPPDLAYEQTFWQSGISGVAGIDEAGRGALAGPVMAAVVVLPPDPSILFTLTGVRDSKQLTPLQRTHFEVLIKETAAAWAVGAASSFEIDRHGIVPATRMAVTRALEQLTAGPEYLLIDYLTLPECEISQSAIVKGDQKSLSIACASVLAKTCRDAHMCKFDESYPGYGFSRHKGYGTPQHLRAMRDQGLCTIHRKSFTLHRAPG